MKKIIISVMIAFVMTNTIGAYSEKIQQELSASLVRLHIIANSNSDVDQKIKLKIRDEILHCEGDGLKKENGDECDKAIKDRLSHIENIANEILRENGFSYTARAEYGRFEFPQKQYKNITLPSGKYYGVRVVLGEGVGENWWCVMYPPLCMLNDNEAVMSESSKKILKEKLSPETYDVIMSKNGEINVKFRIVEFASKIKKHIEEE